MAMMGTTIFSHILPVIFGFFALILIISGSLEDNNPKFVIACVFPYLVLSVLI